MVVQKNCQPSTETFAGPVITPPPGTGGRVLPIVGPLRQGLNDAGEGKLFSMLGHSLEAAIDTVGVGTVLNKGRQLVAKGPRLAQIAIVRVHLAANNARIAQVVDRIEGLQKA